jgi:hypothetical protein
VLTTDRSRTAVRTPLWRLTAILRRESGGPQLAAEPVTESDLSEIRSEAWFTACLRRGHHRCSESEVPIRIRPRLAEGSDRCVDLLLEVTNPDEVRETRIFSIRSLRHVAQRAARRLLAEGILRSLDTYVYELRAAPAETSEAPGRVETPAFRFILEQRAPELLALPLSDLREQATAVGEVSGVYPVFYTEEAWARAEMLSRRGAARTPAVETGGVLVGLLCACPRTGETFAVISDVFGVEEADERGLALSYTGASWARVEEALRERREESGVSAYRLLGQCHGHNFLPTTDEALCGDCTQRENCSCSSVFVSESDRKWSQAVFSHQPWQLCHIFGLTARGAPTHALFGQRDGRLEIRGYYLIPAFPLPVPPRRRRRGGQEV